MQKISRSHFMDKIKRCEQLYKPIQFTKHNSMRFRMNDKLFHLYEKGRRKKYQGVEKPSVYYMFAWCAFTKTHLVRTAYSHWLAFLCRFVSRTIHLWFKDRFWIEDVPENSLKICKIFFLAHLPKPCVSTFPILLQSIFFTLHRELEGSWSMITIGLLDIWLQLGAAGNNRKKGKVKS